MTVRAWMVTAILGAAVLAACSKSAPPESSPKPAAAAPPAAAVVPPATAAPTAQAGMEPPSNLTETLGSKLGLTSTQAAGGVGSILSYAQGKLPAADFSKVSAAIPGAASYQKAAVDAGAVSGPISDPSALTSAFSKLGISPEVAQQLIPAVTEYASKVGGPEVGQLLAGLF